MPIQLFTGDPLASASSTTTDIIKLEKNISKPGRLATTTSFVVGKIVRSRSLKLKSVAIVSTFKGSLRRKLLIPVGIMATVFKGAVRFFLTANPVAPPTATIYRAASNVPTYKAPKFRGSRVIKGDLVPLTFKVTGEKLDSLFAEFTATRKDDPLAAPIFKTGSAIHLTSPVLDTKNQVEIMSGSIYLQPSDTDSFPDREIELSYRLKLLDGIGRIYTVECGNFTVANC